MRCAILPSSGDPFILSLFLKTFQTWKDEVDRLYICYNHNADSSLFFFLKNKVDDPKITFIYVDHSLSHGEAISTCLKAGNEELIFLIEEDAYAFRKGFIDHYFKMIESGEYDMLGSPRFSCTDGIAQATKDKYNLNYEGDRDCGPNFWPNFVFVKRSDLMRTDLNFASKAWNVGETIPYLDLKCERQEVGDSFVWMSIQLRGLGLKIKDILQCHASPDESDQKKNGLGKWHYPDEFGWIHVGSLSAGMTWLLQKNYPTVIINDYALQEFETRMAFWMMAVHLEDYKDIYQLQMDYEGGIVEMTAMLQMKPGRILEKIRMYSDLLSL